MLLRFLSQLAQPTRNDCDNHVCDGGVGTHLPGLSHTSLSLESQLVEVSYIFVSPEYITQEIPLWLTLTV
jgi:hypothetical protein